VEPRAETRGPSNAHVSGFEHDPPQCEHITDVDDGAEHAAVKAGPGLCSCLAETVAVATASVAFAAFVVAECGLDTAKTADDGDGGIVEDTVAEADDGDGTWRDCAIDDPGVTGAVGWNSSLAFPFGGSLWLPRDIRYRRRATCHSRRLTAASARTARSFQCSFRSISSSQGRLRITGGCTSPQIRPNVGGARRGLAHTGGGWGVCASNSEAGALIRGAVGAENA
jgi:hypothetical protein